MEIGYRHETALMERRSEWGLAARGVQSGRGPTTASYRAAMTMIALGGIGVSQRLTEPPEGLAFHQRLSSLDHLGGQGG